MYNMVVDKTTHLSESLLDQVHILNSFSMDLDILSHDYSTYFPDHDAVKVHFQ